MAYCVSGNYTISGCLGVGIDPAGYRLDVSCTGNSSDWLARFQNSNGTEKIGTYISHGSGYGMAIDSTQNNSNYILKLMAGTGGGTGQGSVPVFYAQHDGKIGIGTSSPATRLQIKGTNQYHQISACFFSTYNAGFSFSDDLAGITYDAGTNSLCLYSDYTGYGKVVISTCGVPRLTATVNGNVGIGATSPAAKLHVCGSGDNIFRGESTTTGTVANLFITKAGATGVGYYAGVNVTGAAPGGWEVYDAICNISRLYIKSEGSMGIGTCTPTYKLHVNGTFYAAGSSQDYKQSICNYNTDSCMFMKLKPVTYQYKEEYCHLGKELKSGTQIGLIAEEVAETYPELAILINEAENKVVRNVDYEKLSVILLSEVQKLRREVDDLKHK